MDSNGIDEIENASTKIMKLNHLNRRHESFLFTENYKKLGLIIFILLMMGVFTLLVIRYPSIILLIKSYFNTSSGHLFNEDNVTSYPTTLNVTSSSTDYVVFKTTETTIVNNDNCCKQDLCKKYAQNVLNNINTSVDPCDDFYEFACGRFKLHNPISESSQYVDILTKNIETEYQKLEQLFITIKSNPLFDFVRNFYLTCSNTTIDRTSQFQDWITAIFRSADVIDHWANILVLRPPHILEIQFSKTEADSDESYQLILLNSTSKHRINNNWRDTRNYRRFIESAFAHFFGGQASSYKEISSRIVEFEEEFTYSSSSFSNYDIHGYQWEDLAKKILAILSVKNFKPSYIDLKVSFTYIWRKYGANGVLSGYLKWVFIRDLGFLSGKKFRQIEEKYSDPPRLGERCKKLLLRYSDDLVYKFYIEMNLPDDKINVIKTIFNQTKNNFLELIQSKTWIENDTKDIVKDKLDALKIDVGHPGWNLNQDYLMSKYKSIIDTNMNIAKREDKFFFNLHSIMKLDTKFSLLNFVNNSIPKDPFLKADSSFLGDKNIILITALYLDFIKFHPSLPSYVNLAGIGSDLAHEITHGYIGDSGEFDQFGHRDYEHIKLTADIGRKTQCLADLYDQIEDDVTGIMLNPVITLNENLADNIGLKVAEMTYRKNNVTEPCLPGLEAYNEKQLFYIAFANNWCENRGSKAVVVPSKNMPAKYRVNVPLQNSIFFKEAFQCNWKEKKICDL